MSLMEMPLIVSISSYHFSHDAEAYVVLCLAPGNLGMRPGLRVSQLMNISFDMAAWVSFIQGASLNISHNSIAGNSWEHVQR